MRRALVCKTEYDDSGGVGLAARDLTRGLRYGCKAPYPLDHAATLGAPLHP